MFFTWLLLSLVSVLLLIVRLLKLNSESILSNIYNLKKKQFMVWLANSKFAKPFTRKWHKFYPRLIVYMDISNPFVTFKISNMPNMVFLNAFAPDVMQISSQNKY